MKEHEALNILINAVALAQTKGAYTLEEAKIVAGAVEVFVKEKEAPIEQIVSGDPSLIEDSKKKKK